MEKILNLRWFQYVASVAFIFAGIRLLKLWKKYRNPNAPPKVRAIIDVQYQYVGISLIVGGIGLLIIFIIQDCTGWVAK